MDTEYLREDEQEIAVSHHTPTVREAELLLYRLVEARKRVEELEREDGIDEPLPEGCGQADHVVLVDDGRVTDWRPLADPPRAVPPDCEVLGGPRILTKPSEIIWHAAQLYSDLAEREGSSADRDASKALLEVAESAEQAQEGKNEG